VPVDSFLLSKMAIDIDGFMLNYDLSNIDNKSFTKYIYENHQIQDQLYCFNCSSDLYDKFNSNDINKGITITCGGFYGSQGRSIRLSTSHKNNLSEIKKIKYKNYNATNLEMETAIIYAMSELLGHNAISLNAILANRNLEEYSVKPENTVEKLIEYTLSKL
jgi:uridine phosphorylase